ncbi:MAG: T9SS type A sorting domain-containing protein, partial [Chitinophagaceae bacterium]|nr:T9SS type A sorting domain-containing protein [Chitinophagaceae bacterium]
GNAGAGTFTAGGTDPTPLVSYNPQEYWNIVPAGTATGSVTLYWDGYNDSYNNPISQRRVAHKVGVNWLNEGGTATGTTTSGSVTSNSISSWTTFSLGSISVALPLRWLSVSGIVNNQGNAVISWKVVEEGVKTYEIQKQVAGTFVTIATINSQGNGENAYLFTESIALKESSLYRIRQVDGNGRATFSAVMQLHAPGVKRLLTVFPNPVKAMATVSVSPDLLDKRAWLIDGNGKVLDDLIIKQTSFSIDLSRYQTGTYYLKTADGAVVRMTRL